MTYEITPGLQAAAAPGAVTWPHIIVEEVAEFVAAADDPARSREELIQVAACAVAAVEAIDRQESGDA